jgi:NAD(P)-dependent dehydrogenase (short-subunit alcohol dehydrogenase family)
MTDVRFDGRTVIVTGAGRGLGRAYALEVGRRGGNVVVNDLGGTVEGHDADQTPADAVVAEITAEGGSAVASYASVAEPEGAAAIVATAVDAFGGVDAVISNAGILRGKSVLRTTPEDFEAHLAVHTKGGFYVAQAALPSMRERGYGRFVFISSMAGIFGLAGAGAYGTAKAGLVGLSNVLAIEGARRGIRSNVVAPVAASTRMAAMAGAGAGPASPEVEPRLREQAVVPMVVYLASEACEHTGAIFSAGGGRYARIVAASAPGWWSPEGTASVEDIRDHLDVIEDLSEPVLFENGDAEMKVIMRGPGRA